MHMSFHVRHRHNSSKMKLESSKWGFSFKLIVRIAVPKIEYQNSLTHIRFKSHTHFGISFDHSLEKAAMP